MRVNSANNSPYTYQRNVQNSPQNNTESVKNPKGEVCVRLELSHTVPVLKESEPAEETFSRKMKLQLQKDWKFLREWMKKTAEKSKELWAKLMEKVAEVTAKFSSLWTGQERRPAETNAPQSTWQENFRKKVKIFFDAVAGFLSRHLPMNNGGFAETKEEKKEEDLTGKSDSKEEKKEHMQSTFDVRG